VAHCRVARPLVSGRVGKSLGSKTSEEPRPRIFNRPAPPLARSPASRGPPLRVCWRPGLARRHRQCARPLDPDAQRAVVAPCGLALQDAPAELNTRRRPTSPLCPAAGLRHALSKYPALLGTCFWPVDAIVDRGRQNCTGSGVTISGKAVPQFWLSVVDHRMSLPSSPPLTLIVPMHEAGDCGVGDRLAQNTAEGVWVTSRAVRRVRENTICRVQFISSRAQTTKWHWVRVLPAREVQPSPRRARSAAQRVSPSSWPQTIGRWESANPDRPIQEFRTRSLDTCLRGVTVPAAFANRRAFGWIRLVVCGRRLPSYSTLVHSERGWCRAPLGCSRAGLAKGRVGQRVSPGCHMPAGCGGLFRSPILPPTK